MPAIDIPQSSHPSRHVYSSSFSSSVRSTTPRITSPLPLAYACSATTNSQSHSKKRARHSLNVLGSLPKDISALIRSHSSSRRQNTQAPEIYAGIVEMVPDDDRPSRKSKSENRLYNFIARSLTRSRSRSRHDRTPSIDPDEPIPDLPNSRRRVDSMGQSTPSKPATRIQSRPLSSTTTATNTTITPGTPRPKKRPPSTLPIPLSPNGVDPPGPPSSRPTTPKASAARKKLHNLFGIPLSSPKKSSFGSSRPGSRRASLEVAPPLPGYENTDEIEDNDPTPKPLKSYSPHSYSRPESPSPNSRAKPPTRNTSTSSTNTSSTSASSRLQKFFGGHKTPPPSAEAVSGPMKRPSGSSHQRRNSNTSNSNSTGHNPPSSDAQHRTNAVGAMGPPALPPPRIVHVPPTPVRVERAGTAPHSAASRLGQQKDLMDSGHRYGSSGRGDERVKEREADGLGSMNGHARGKTGHGQGHSRRSTKHGSFDFERPGWSAVGAVQRSGSGGTSATGTSETGTTGGGWGRAHDSGAGIRESAMGPGLAGVGTLQRDVSVKRGKEREEMVVRAREEERRKRKELNGEKDREKEPRRDSGKGSSLDRHRSLQPSPRTRTSDEKTAASTEKSSSWGKKRGGLFSGGGKGNVGPHGLSHGPFAFEPPVPSPTRSTGSTGTAGGHDTPLSVSWAGERGRGEREREKGRVKGDAERERDKLRERDKERRSHSAYKGDRAPVPVPPASIGHRSGAKGRSLDLGLGLAWAPTTVRENALLPPSGFFGRSLSGSSSIGGHSVGSAGGRSISGSTNGHGTIEEENERSGVGKEVAEVFRNALDDAGYAAFKKYVHRFDAHDIPFDGPTGIVARVEKLLMTAPALSEDGKRRLLDNFVRVILQSASP